MTNPQDLVDQLRKIRRSWNLSIDDVAELLGASDSTIRKAESNVSKALGIYTLCRWADSLGCDIKIELRGSREEKKNGRSGN